VKYLDTGTGYQPYDVRRGVLPGTEQIPKDISGAEEAKIAPEARAKIITEWFKPNGIQEKTQAAQISLQSIQEAKTALSKGMQTGAFADYVTSWRSVGAAMGLSVDENKLQNTQAYQDFIANTVVPRMKELGGNDSEEELRTMFRTTGGDITRQPEVLAKVLELIERAQIKKIQEGARVYNIIKPYVGDYNPSYAAPPGGGAESDPLGIR
jgi:hypothetical protein